jgi:hypothetical protein
MGTFGDQAFSGYSSPVNKLLLSLHCCDITCVMSDAGDAASDVQNFILQSSASNCLGFCQFQFSFDLTALKENAGDFESTRDKGDRC